MLRSVAYVGFDKGEVQLTLEVLLESLRRDDIVVKTLATFLVLLGPLRATALKN